MPEIIHDEPRSIVETHLGRPRPKVRHQLEEIILENFVDHDTVEGVVDMLLDAIHEQMTFRSGWGAVVIQRIKRGEDL